MENNVANVVSVQSSAQREKIGKEFGVKTPQEYLDITKEEILDGLIKSDAIGCVVDYHRACYLYAVYHRELWRDLEFTQNRYFSDFLSWVYTSFNLGERAVRYYLMMVRRIIELGLDEETIRVMCLIVGFMKCKSFINICDSVEDVKYWIDRASVLTESELRNEIRGKGFREKRLKGRVSVHFKDKNDMEFYHQASNLIRKLHPEVVTEAQVITVLSSQYLSVSVNDWKTDGAEVLSLVIAAIERRFNVRVTVKRKDGERTMSNINIAPEKKHSNIDTINASRLS